MIAKIIILLFISSCTKYHEIKKKNGIYFIEDVQTELVEAKEIDWDIGRKREENISKGIKLTTTIPNLDDEAIETLNSQLGIDSWVYRLTRIRRGKEDILGYFYYRFNNITRSTKFFSISLFYHAASVSKKFRLFHCPAFDHRLKIKKYDLETRRGKSSDDIYVRPIDNIVGKVTRLRFAPMIVSGGRMLEGEYVLDLALYSENTKRKYSEWMPVAKSLKISQEVTINVSSCNGVREELNPLPESRSPDIRDLEIR